MKRALNITVLILLGVILVTSCRNKRNPGRTYMPDMRFARAYEHNTVNPNFEDGMTNREPVEGTIPRGFMPYHLQDTPEDYLLAATEVHNPLEFDQKYMDNGKKLYTIYCQVCHGETGDGKGTIKKFEYPIVPAYKERLPTITEGQMFHVITYGKNLMGGYAPQLSPDERWQVVYYIQKLGEVGPFAVAPVVAPAETPQ